jgi:hypothetical protein
MLTDVVKLAWEEAGEGRIIYKHLEENDIELRLFSVRLTL